MKTAQKHADSMVQSCGSQNTKLTNRTRYSISWNFNLKNNLKGNFSKVNLILKSKLLRFLIIS
jgi:hypothetical protein